MENTWLQLLKPRSYHPSQPSAEQVGWQNDKWKAQPRVPAWVSHKPVDSGSDHSLPIAHSYTLPPFLNLEI